MLAFITSAPVTVITRFIQSARECSRTAPACSSTITFSIHGPAITSVAAMPISFGMNDSVISLICVAA